jgi:hypothetical protein
MHPALASAPHKAITHLASVGDVHVRREFNVTGANSELTSTANNSEGSPQSLTLGSTVATEGVVAGVLD